MADETISFSEGEDGVPAEESGGPRRRKAEAGTDVIDLTSMRAELEGKRGGAR